MSLHFVHPVVDDDAVSDSTSSTGSKLSRGSGFSAKRVPLFRELQNLRRQTKKQMRCESDLRFTQMEALGRCLEEERVVHVLKREEQDDRIAELESFQKQLGLEQKAHRELIDSETLKIKALSARINSLSRRGEVHDNDLIKLAQLFKETSAEYRVKFEDFRRLCAEDQKICQTNYERCSQLEELMQRFEMQIAATNAKLSEFESEHAFHTRKTEGQDDRIAELGSFQKQLDLEQKAQSEQIDSELTLNTREIEELAARINSLGHKGEVRDNELMELSQRLKETSAECNSEFEDSHRQRAEDRKVCLNNNERCSQLEKLMRFFETHIAETNAKLSEFESKNASHMRRIEGQDDRIAELESQKPLELAQEAQSAQVESERAPCTREIEGVRAQIDILRCNDEVRNNDLRDLRTQLDELTQRLETKIMQHKLKFHQYSELNHTGAAVMNSGTFRDQFESRFASEHKTCQELIEAVVKSLPTWLQDMTAMFNARNENLMSILDARCDDREE